LLAGKRTQVPQGNNGDENNGDIYRRLVLARHVLFPQNALRYLHNTYIAIMSIKSCLWKIWYDPVWSKVIAGIILFLLSTALGVLGHARFLIDSLSPRVTLFGSVIGGLVSIAIIFVAARNLMKKKKDPVSFFADYYSTNKTFTEAFVNSDNPQSAFRRIAYKPESRYLREKLINDGLVRDSRKMVPSLNDLGERVLAEVQRRRT